MEVRFSRDAEFRPEPGCLGIGVEVTSERPKDMTKIGQEAFTREAWSLVGRKVSKARLINDIYETACASVALPVDEDSVAIIRLIADLDTPA